MSSSEETILRGICRVLIMRILEAASVRDLLNEQSMKEARKNIPGLVENMINSNKMNSQIFEERNFNPIPIQNLDDVLSKVNLCDDTEELIRLAEVSRFIMEKEVYMITKRVIDQQS